MKTPTPRTDEAAEFVYLPSVGPRVQIKAVGIDFARQLETELAAAKAERDEWKRFADDRVADLQRADVSHGETISNRDNWREVADALAEVAGHIGYTSSEETRVCVEAERALAAYRKLKEGK